MGGFKASGIKRIFRAKQVRTIIDEMQDLALPVAAQLIRFGMHADCLQVTDKLLDH